MDRIMKEILIKQNIHWHNRDFETGIGREILLKIIPALDIRHVIAISGARRSGKSYLFRQMIRFLMDQGHPPENILQVDFEDPFFISVREDANFIEKIYSEYLSLKNPQGPVYLFFDEVANRPHVHQELKNLYDSENVKIFASSSSTSILRDSKAFLTGRARIMEVLPLNFNEFLDFKGYQPKTAEKYLLESHFEQYMQMGGIPEYVLTEDISYLDNLIEDIIYKDIVAYHAVRDVAGIKNLFRLLMERCGKQVSINKISKVIGIVPDTVRRYIDYFMQTFLIYTVERCGKLNERIRSPKKLYAADVGIRNHITGFRDKGAVFENLVFLRIKHHSPCYIYQDGIELDFYCNDTLLEVKYNRELESKQQNLYENFQARRKMLIDSLEDYLKLE